MLITTERFCSSEVPKIFDRCSPPEIIRKSSFRGMREHRTRNLEIPRRAIAHRGMTESKLREARLIRHKSQRVRSAELSSSPRAETALGLDKTDDTVETLALPEIGHDKWAFPAHPSRVGIHLVQRCADMRREVDLVDDEKIRPDDAGAALGGDLVAGGDVDHVDGEIGQFGREGGREIVAAGFAQ